MSALLRTKRFVWSLALGILLLLALVGWNLGRRYIEASEWVTHTFEVTAAIHEVSSLAKDVETGQRGYLLSGDEVFLVPYVAAVDALPRSLERLATLVSDNAAQKTRLVELRGLVEEKLAFSARTLEVHRSGGDASALVRSGQGKRLMDAIRARSTAMLADERTLLARRVRDAVETRALTVRLAIGGALVFLSLIVWSLFTTRRDLEELRALTEEVLLAEEKFRELAEHASELVQLVEPSGRCVYASPSAFRLLGYTPEELQNLPAAELLHPEDLGRAEEHARTVLTKKSRIDEVALRYRTKAGEYRWFEISLALLLDSTGAPKVLLVSGRDIHERHQAEIALAKKKEELETLSATDALTGLLNRRGFTDAALARLAMATAQHRPLAVVFVDLDGLKPINDELGHEMGDRALVEAGRVLRQVCRGDDLVARLGGDEFAVLAMDLSPAGFERFRERIEGALENVNAESARKFALRFSLGAAFLDPSSPESLDSLVERADRAMYEEKRRRKASSRGTSARS